MRISVFVLLCLALVFGGNAQVKTPSASPPAHLEQTVGLTQITVDYSRPHMRGRKIFGELVPYGKIWRTGANNWTTVSFSKDVMINDKPIKAGKYAILTVPNPNEWEVVFYTETNGGIAPQQFDESKVALRTMVKAEQLPVAIQSFMITFDDITETSALLEILWESTYLDLKIQVPTDQEVIASIDKAMAGPTANDYFASAVYYLNSGRDINKAKEWMDKAMGMFPEPAYWQLRQKALIYAKAGDKKGAVAAAKASLAAAEKAGNMDYVALNKASLKEWGE